MRDALHAMKGIRPDSDQRADKEQKKALLSAWKEKQKQDEGGFCDCEILLNCYERYELDV